MQTKLDERANLIQAIDKLNYQDRQKLSIFLAGIEAGKQMQSGPEQPPPEKQTA